LTFEKRGRARRKGGGGWKEEGLRDENRREKGEKW
jgi:hypothetical protein